MKLKTCLLQGRAVKTAKSLDEGLSKVLVMDNIFGIDTNNVGSLVYLTGELSTGKVRFSQLTCPLCNRMGEIIRNQTGDLNLDLWVI